MFFIRYSSFNLIPPAKGDWGTGMLRVFFWFAVKHLAKFGLVWQFRMYMNATSGQNGDDKFDASYRDIVIIFARLVHMQKFCEEPVYQGG